MRAGNFLYRCVICYHPPMAQKVFVGLSGGVDSAVSAALLKEQGHEVTGVFIRIYRPEFIECTWKEDRLDAMRVCAALSIPFREIDLSDAYKKEVVDSMIADYKAGITPNPDVLCNATIKFGAFLEWALKEGADKIATGHYALIRTNKPIVELLRGKDASKDQSYFLYRLTQKELQHVVFPVGDMLKSEVRQKALELNLPVANKHDSQGLCFIGDVSIADFLKRFIDLTPGPVVDTDGNTIGEHEGAALLTVGQRHGFSLAKNQENVPHYVTTIDASTNTVVVSARKDDAATKVVAVRNVSWVNESPQKGQEVLVQARYREKPVPATVEPDSERTIVTFAEPHTSPVPNGTFGRVAAPGQSLVVYTGDVCLGGGVIEKAL